MRYKDKKIDIPSPEDVLECMTNKKKPNKFSVDDFMTYWNKLDWKFAHKPLQSLEQAISIFQQRINRALERHNKHAYKRHEKKLQRTEETMIFFGHQIAEKLHNKNKKSTISVDKQTVSSKDDKLTNSQKYAKLLEDTRWKAFREFVLFVRGKKCEKCGSTHILQVHHPFYKKGRNYPWCYTCDEVIVLCKACHEREHGINHDV